jgi:hypothetical protein
MRSRAAFLVTLCGWAVYMLMRPTLLSVTTDADAAGVRALRGPIRMHSHPHAHAAHPHQKSHEALRRGAPSVQRATATHALPPIQVRPPCDPQRCTRSHPARRARTPARSSSRTHGVVTHGVLPQAAAVEAEESTMGSISVPVETANSNQPEPVGNPLLSWTQCGSSLQGRPLALLPLAVRSDQLPCPRA